MPGIQKFRAQVTFLGLKLIVFYYTILQQNYFYHYYLFSFNFFYFTETL